MSSPFQVYKFGGSSLGTPGRLPRVLSLVAAAPRPLVVVVSALGEATDWLIAAGRAAEAGKPEEAQAQVARLRALARSSAASVLADETRGHFERRLESLLAPLERLLTGIALTRECSAATLDEVMSVGERISAELLALALEEHGTRAHAVDARELLVTDGNAGAARVDEAPSRERVQRLASTWRESVPVVTGFIARSHAGRTTTLGRNGSDYTATLLAHFLGARAR
jgi:bifunctional aspartokinase / homoserine dehydrogenase 1